MRIGLDGHTLALQAGGNRRYVEGLLEGLAELQPNLDLRLYVTSDHLPDAARWGSCTVARLRSRTALTRLTLELPRRLSEDRVDLGHFQYVGPLRSSCPLVIAVHDVSFRLAPRLSGWRLATRMLLTTGWALRRARAVLTPSAWTARTLARYYPTVADRVRVVPLGVSERFAPRPQADDARHLERLGVPPSFFLYVGRQQRRKNVTGLLDAFVVAAAQDPGLPPLLLVGPAGSAPVRLPPGSGPSGRPWVQTLGEVPDAMLPALYRAARALVFPGRHEGFGLPVLEAMACGCPVVAAREGALPELVADTGILVSPIATGDWARAIVELHQDPARRETLSRLGVERARQYSWRRTAEETVHQYAAVLDGG